MFAMYGIECKMNGYLSKEEKQKCELALKLGAFSKIWVAKKTKIKNKVVIDWRDFGLMAKPK
jgi:hypothetical protein